jgi:hypothetical protein
MAVAPDLDQIRPGIFVWQAYDSTVKTDLFSTAIALRDGIFLVDPILLRDDAMAQLVRQAPLAGIVVTNANHLRAADDYVGKFSVPLFASRDSAVGPHNFVEIADGDRIGGDLEVSSIVGAPPGEIALYHSADGGTFIIGDALINFDPYGFAFLPAKYCENAKQMRASLRKLLRYKCERMLFAHGTPILSRADSQLRELLDGDSKP